MTNIIIGPYNNREKPEKCPDKWWDDYKDWLPKEWIGRIRQDGKLDIIPYYPLETEQFRGWDKKPTVDEIIIEFLRFKGSARTSEIASFLKKQRRSVQQRLSNLVKKGILQSKNTYPTDPTTVYYIIEDAKND